MTENERKERKQPQSRTDRRAESEIRRQQKSTERAIPYACFKRLARQTLDEDVPQSGDRPFRFKPSGVKLLQEATEAYIVEQMACARVSMHSHKRRTAMPADLDLVLDIQRIMAHQEPRHEKPEPPSRRKRSRSRAKITTTASTEDTTSNNKKLRVTQQSDELEQELEALLQPIDEEEEAEEIEEEEEQEEEEEEQASEPLSLEKEIEREPDSTDFQYEREEMSDMY